jgi:ArsR family transcriptional regulator
MAQPVHQVQAEFFKTLGHPARIRILELLLEADRSVGQLVSEVGVEASHLSHQLAVLRRAGVVEGRKVGTNIVYSVVDPRLSQLLELARQILASSLLGARELLANLESRPVRGGGGDGATQPFSALGHVDR